MAAHSVRQDSLVGQTLGHYRVVEMIGVGGMGEVYRARDQHLDRDAAIKVLPLQTFSDESARRHFRKEALALSKLNHPNIATVYDFDTQQGVDFLVMEYIPGITLSDRLTAGPLREKEVVALGTQLAEGLAAAHEHGVVHRDLKPGNLRLTGDNRLKILDFGLARLRRRSTATAVTESFSEAHALAGTLPYMAPEQLLGGEIDARTDIHAAGAVLYEMATGRGPFAEAEGSELISAILRKSPQPPGEVNPGISPELGRIIGKCMDKQADSRYQSATELAVDLRRLERSTEATMPVRTGTRQMPGWASLRRILLTLTCAVVLVLAVVAIVRWDKYFRTAVRPTSTSIAVLPFADLSSSHDLEYFSDGLAEEILNDLTKIPNLKVVARTSAFQFKGKSEDLRVIGEKLNVKNVLEGSVRSEGTRVRITAQLVKADDGFHLWSESYDRDLKDVLTVEDDIAKAVTSALQLKMLAGNTPASLPTSRTTNPVAYQDFLQSRYFANKTDKESGLKALDYINRAILADPRYAPAYALRAELTASSGAIGWTNYPEAIRKARADIEKAIELDPNLADPYRLLSLIQSTVESNCRAAETTIKRAQELTPGNADVLAATAVIANCLGRQEEAVGILNQALQLDPLVARRYLRLAQYLRNLGRYEDSLRALTKALDLNAQEIWIHETWGEVYLAQGQPGNALGEMEKEPAGCFHDLGMTLAYHALGRHQESNAALESLIAQNPNACGYQIAEAYAYRGEADQAFEWLNRAYTQHDGGLRMIKTDLLLKNVRGDPRYGEMLKRLNLGD